MTPLHTFETGEYVMGLAFSPDTDAVVALQLGGPVHVCAWRPAVQQRKFVSLRGSGRFAYESIKWLDDGRIAVSGFDGAVRFWNRHTGQQTSVFRPTPCRRIAVSRSGLLAACDEPSAVSVWDIDARVCLWRRHSVGPGTALAISDDGGMVIQGRGTGEITVWRRGETPSVTTIVAHDGDVLKLAVRNNDLWASIGADNRICVWPGDCSQRLTEWFGDCELLDSIALSPDNQLIACGAGFSEFSKGDHRGSTFVWSLERGKLLDNQRGDARRILAVDLTNDRVASADEQGTVVVSRIG